MIKLYAVDDDPGFLEVLDAVASPMGFEIVTVVESRLLKSVYLGEPNAVVVIDMVMPEVDGIEVFNWLIKERPPGAIIFISGYSEQNLKMVTTLARGVGLRMLETLVKPVKLAQLRGALLNAKNAVISDKPTI